MGVLKAIKDFFRGKKSTTKKRTQREERGDSVAASERRQTLDFVRGKSEQTEKKEKERKEAYRVKEFRSNYDTKKSMQEAEAARAKRKANLEKFNKATNDRYNVKGAKPGAEKLKRRQAQKSQAFDAEAAKIEMKLHPKVTSAARGAATFGASDLLAAKGTKGKAREVEKHYQKNKSKGWETAGEIAGSLASFSLTSGASAKAAGKLAPKALKEFGEAEAQRIARGKLIQKAAEKEAKNAVKQGLFKDASKETIDRIAKGKADDIIKNLAEDAAVNMTTGALFDFNKATAANDIGSKEWNKEMRNNALLNLGLGTAATVGLPAAGTAIKRGLGGTSETTKNVAKAIRATDALDDLRRTKLAGSMKREAPRIGESLDARIARANAPQPVADMAEQAAKATEATPEARIAPSEAVNAAEQAKAVPTKVKATVKAAEETRRDAREILRNKSIPLEEKRAAYKARMDEIDRELDEAHNIAANTRLDQAQRDAAAQRFDDLAEEGKALAADMKKVEEAESTFPYATAEDRIPTGDIKQTEMNDAVAEAEARAKAIAGGEEPRMGAAASETAETATDELPKGVRDARKSFEEIRGEKVEKGTTPPSTKEVYDAYKDYHISQGTESRVKQSRAAASQINMMTEDAEKELRKKFVEQGYGDYQVIFTPELYDQISNEFKSNSEYWINRIMDGADDLSKVTANELPEMQARAEYLMAVLDPSKGADIEDTYLAAMRLAKDLSSKSGQTLNIRRNFVKLTRAGKIQSTMDDLVKLVENSEGFAKAHKDMPRGKYDRINYIKGVLMSDADIEKAVTKLVDAKTPEATEEAYAEMLIALNKQNPKAGFDVVQELRYLNMLGNPKTHIRNVFGSAFFAPIRQTSNMIRSAIEDSIAKKAGLEITKHGGLSLEAMKEAWSKNPTTEAGKAAQEAFERLKTDILGSAKYGTQTYKGRSKTAAGKAFDALSDFNSNLLTKEDDFFRSRAFKENYIKSYNRYLKDGKPITEKIKRQIENEAIKEAQIATFNEYNEFAKALNKITRNANNANASAGAKWAGRAVNAVMPFEKVPANLMKQSINYSPLGIAKGFSNIKKAAREGDAELLNRAIDELASGTTGTGIFALGALLGTTTDMFTTNAGKNDPGAKFKKDRGMQNYSVTFKDPKTGKGYSFTLDWLVPSSATFFSGVEFANQLKNGGNPLTAISDWSTVTSRLIEPVMETSMLSGLHGMLETMRSGYNGDDEKGALDILLRETVQSYLNSMIPTFAGQVARTAYKTDMQVTGDSDWEYWKNSIKSKAGLANTNILGEALGADTDAYGNVKGEKNSTEDYIRSGLKNFLSPANIQKVDFSEIDNEKLRIYEEAVKDGKDPNDMAYLFPKKQYKKQFSVGDEDVKMSNKEVSLYNQAKAKGGADGMRAVLESYMFNQYEKDDSGKRTVLKNGYTQEQKDALIKKFEGKSMREVEEWLYKQPQFRSASEADKKKAIDQLWNLTQDKAKGSQQAGERAVYEAQGKDGSEYDFKNEVSKKKQENLQPFIDAGIVSYEDAVDFARNAGKTYYYPGEDEDSAGTSKTYYNKTQMMEYLMSKGYSEEEAAALYNSFKASNAKEYGSSSGRRGYRRRGYRRRGGGGGTKVHKLKTSAYKTKQFKAKNAPKAKTSSANGAKSLAAGLKELQQTQAKVAPPKAKKGSNK